MLLSPKSYQIINTLKEDTSPKEDWDFMFEEIKPLIEKDIRISLAQRNPLTTLRSYLSYRFRKEKNLDRVGDLMRKVVEGKDVVENLDLKYVNKNHTESDLDEIPGYRLVMIISANDAIKYSPSKDIFSSIEDIVEQTVEINEYFKSQSEFEGLPYSVNMIHIQNNLEALVYYSYFLHIFIGDKSYEKLVETIEEVNENLGIGYIKSEEDIEL